jgi:GT2 family glycosyltransferase
MIRGEVFYDVGMYDERFTLHYWDLDWSVRAMRKGYTFAFLPEVRVVREHDTRVRNNTPTLVAEYLPADLYLAYKHGSRRWASVLYWEQRIFARWLAFRWRKDNEASRDLADAMARMNDLHRTWGEENRPPLPVPDQS